MNDLLAEIDAAIDTVREVAVRTPLLFNENLSRQYACDVYLKREDLQVVRSYKIRGAYNMIRSLDAEQLQRGIVCASAGNHAQGVAYSCRKLGVRGIIFMPVTTPQQKIQQTRFFGESFIEIRLAGDSFDDCAEAAQLYASSHNMKIIPPFDHPDVIAGQATIAKELMDDLPHADYVFVPVGGGGLAAGVGSYYKSHDPHTKITGVEPAGAASMRAALDAGRPVNLDGIDRFVDGAAVRRVGDLTFKICREVLHDMITVEEGKICSTILQLYNQEGLIVEPAGALSIAALESRQHEIRGKKVICIVSGSNNDFDRMQEIKERSLQYEGIKHYFLVNFAQRPGALKLFVNQVLGKEDDITRFEYLQKNNRENAPALVGIQLGNRSAYDCLIENLHKYSFSFKEIAQGDELLRFLV